MIDGYQGDWLLQLHDHYPNSRRWLVISPAQPSLTKLAQDQGCGLQQQIDDYQWLCATPSGLWMLQHEQPQWWLTFWPRQASAPKSHWVGNEISRHHSELYELALFDSTYTGQQLFDYSKFKWGQRTPLLREIGHGQFHIQLQNPAEDLFVVQQQATSLVLQFRAKSSPARPGSG